MTTLKSYFRNAFFITVLGCCQTVICQETAFNNTPTVTVKQNERIKKLVVAKSKMTFNDRYKIQLYYGNLAGANKALGKYKSNFKEWSSSIEFETPNHKVWVGNFRNRIEADRALKRIQKKFSSAFVFKPDRKK